VFFLTSHWFKAAQLTHWTHFHFYTKDPILPYNRKSQSPNTLVKLVKDGENHEFDDADN